MCLRDFDSNTSCGLFVRPFPTSMNASMGCRNILETLRIGEFSVAHLPTDMVVEEIVAQLREAQVIIYAADCNSEVDLN